MQALTDPAFPPSTVAGMHGEVGFVSQTTDLIAQFLSAPKTTDRRWRWNRGRQHPDYAEARNRLLVEESPFLYGRMVATAHLYRVPAKYGFNVFFRGRRILALDVSPGHSHRLTSTGQPTGASHWHIWPNPDKAIPDERSLLWSQWLDEFIRRAHIRLSHPLAPPPFMGGRQLGFEYDSPANAK